MFHVYLSSTNRNRHMSKANDSSYNKNIMTTYTSCLPASMTPVRFHVPPVVNVLDTETTGFYSLAKGRYPDRDKGGDELVSVGLVKIREDQIIAREEWFINPGRPIPYETTRVHGITDEMVKNKPYFKDVAQDIFKFMGDEPLVIHNSDFDVGFLFYALIRAGIKLPQYRIIDTLELARTSLPLGKSASLDSVMSQLGITHIDRAQHGALKDALATALVYLAFRNSALKLKDLPNPQPLNMPPRPIRTGMLDERVKQVAERFLDNIEKKRAEQQQSAVVPTP